MYLPKPDTYSYLNAKPFPHAVFDFMFDPLELRRLIWPDLTPSTNDFQKKRAGTTDQIKFGYHTANWINRTFHNQNFIFFLEELSGINGLVLDCREIGLHETFKGGYLEPHVDYSINEITGLEHRINAILYLNNCEGGELELYQINERNGKPYSSEMQIQPKFNRLVVFNVENAWHGHPNPLLSDSRRSIALNYFSIPKTNSVNIPTVYKKRRSWMDVSPRKILGLFKK